MNKALRPMVIILAIVVGLVLAKNAIAKRAIMGGVKAMTGLNLHIASMDVGILKSAVGIRELRLENPAGFPDRVMMELPEVYVDYDLGAFFGGRVHLKEVRLNLQEFNVVKDAHGRVNLDALKVVQESKAGAGKPAPKPKAGKAPQLQIDALQLKVGKVVYKDYSRGGAPMIQEFPVSLNERYAHITDPQAVAALIVSRALVNTTVARLTNLNLNSLQSLVGSEVLRVTDLVGGAVSSVVGQAGSTAQEAAGISKDAVDAAAGAVKKTTESLKKVLPFGQ